ncbi:type II toxin-antitoxin system PemK/MazF family toxin [Lactiplantibacillus nangangensis]|uniref:Type II toxin-antitoxin system PemK/MazF family toxin n=1 Tax=Lactiplantibacillus nangangensis TaxID=2559917 RepID=A0ABW1SNU0_9LACO|nr:type II toxin-antitoxin system PemK/MazF family toxin [Lactiplantibacillus nangangensis]
MRFPIQGDVVVIDAEPHSGIEYGGHDQATGNVKRYMVVMSSSEYNQMTGLILAMPITTVEKYHNNPHYMPILISGNSETGVKGYVVLWQLQNFDYGARHGRIVNHISVRLFNQLTPYVHDMLGLN